MQGRRLAKWAMGVGAIGFALALTGGSPATGAPGDTFYLAPKTGERVIVSWVVRADSNEVSELLMGVLKIPCKGHRPPPKPQSYIKPPLPADFDTPVPIVDGTFEELWREGYPKGGGIVGRETANGFAGTLRANLYLKRKGGTDATCKSGRREWTAKPVSEERWNKAREKYVFE